MGISTWNRMPRGVRIAVLFGGLLAIALLIFLLSRGMMSDEERVRAAVLDAIHAAERERLDRLGDVFSKDYRGYYGNNYSELMDRARRDFTLIDNLSIDPTAWEITITEGTRAEVALRFRFSLIYGQIGPYRNVPLNRHPNTPPGADETARLVLEREADGRWRIVELDADVPHH